MKDCEGFSVATFIPNESGRFKGADKEKWFRENILNQTKNKKKAYAIYDDSMNVVGWNIR